jgi:hypothetical protein
MFSAAVMRRNTEGSCGKIADAEPRTQIHRQPRDVARAEHDVSRAGTLKTDQHVKGRRLARAVCAEQADDFALLDMKRNAAHDMTLAVSLVQLEGSESFACDKRSLNNVRRRLRGRVAFSYLPRLILFLVNSYLLQHSKVSNRDGD